MQMNPETMSAAMGMMNNMSDDQLRSMSSMTGMNIDPNMLRMSMNMMNNMSPEQKTQMMQQAQQMQQSGNLPFNLRQGAQSIPKTPVQTSKPSISSWRDRSKEFKDFDELKEMIDAGNSAYKQGDYAEAEDKFQQSLLLLEDLHVSYDNKEAGLVDLAELNIRLNLMSSCDKAGRFTELINHAKITISLDKANVKGNYLYAKALHELGKHKAALSKIAIAKQNSSQKEIIDLYNKLHEATKIEETADIEKAEEAIIKQDITEDQVPPPISSQGLNQMSQMQGNLENYKKQAKEIGQKLKDPSFREFYKQQYRNQTGSELSDSMINTMIAQADAGDAAGIQEIDENAYADMTKKLFENPQQKEMMKNMMKQQFGFEVNDQMLEMMQDPNMIKMAKNMQANGTIPTPPQNIRQQESPATNIPNTSQHEVTQPQSPGMPDMSSFMGPNGTPPDMGSVFGNKDMVKMMFGMLKNNPQQLKTMLSSADPNNTQIGMLQNISDANLSRIAAVLEKLYLFFYAIWPALKIIKRFYRELGVLLVAYLIYKFLL